MNKLEKFKRGEIVLHAPTIEIYEKLLKWCNSKGMRWASETPAYDDSSMDYWSDYEYDTCVSNVFGSISYSKSSYYKKSDLIETLTEQDFSFTKDDLQSGMVVTTRNSQRYLVLRGDMKTRQYGRQKLIFMKEDDFIEGSSFSNNLNNIRNKSFDIVKIHEPYVQSPDTIFCLDENLVWERDEDLREIIENFEKEFAKIKQKFARWV